MLIDIRIPARQKPSKDSFDIRSRAVEKWVRSLPLANLGETSRRVYKVLLEINGLEFSNRDRYAALVALHPTITHIVDGLRKHYAGQTFPLLDKNRNVVELAQEILSEMAVGHKIIVVSGIAKPARSERKIIPAAALYATHYLVGMLMEVYEVYAPCRQNIWRELHQLYLVAETKGFANERINDVTDLTEDSIADVYLRTVLLAAAGPYRLRQGEVRRVYKWLTIHSAFAKLVPINDPEAQHAIHYVRFDSDEPPTALRPDNSQLAPQQSRAVVLTDLIKAITREIEVASSNADPKGANTSQADLLRRLLAAWGAFTRRRFTRIDKASDLSVSVGLDALHHFCSLTVKRPSFIGTEYSDPVELWDMNAYRTSYDRLANTPHVYPRKIERAAPLSTTDIDHAAHNWQLRNVSAGGYCLLWDKQQSCKAQVGELIGISDKIDTASGWRICAVRWMKSRRGKGLEIGVQVLGPCAQSASVRVRRKSETEPETLRCLVIPELKPLNQPETIITPALVFQIGGVLSLQRHDIEQTIRLTRLLEQTGHYAIYEFLVLETPETQSDLATSGLDFESLWSSI